MTHPLPNFIGIGAGKAGTSWLYSILSKHPEICISSAKETLFFEDHYNRGLQWYAKFFSHCQNSSAIGEVSNTYIFSSFAPARVHAFNPDIQLIATLRNPVDRAFSHYLFHYRNAQVEGSFESAIEQMPDIVDRGLYYSYLKNYFQYFPREQLLCLLFDDLKHDPVAVAHQVLSFLQVDASWATPAFVDTQRLPASKPRSKLLARSVKRAAHTVRELGFPEAITKVKTSPIANLLYRPYKKHEYPRMDPKIRQQLNEYFRADVCQLSQLLNRDLESLWLS